MDSKTKERIFYAVGVLGFILIPIFVPRIVGLIGAHFGLDVKSWVKLLWVAFFFYIWGETCLYIKNTHDIE